MIMAGVLTILVLQNYRRESKPKNDILCIFSLILPTPLISCCRLGKSWILFLFFALQDLWHSLKKKQKRKKKAKKKVHQDLPPTILGPICSPCAPSSLERQRPAKTKEQRLRVSSDCIILVLTRTFYWRPSACSLNVLQGRVNGQKTAKVAFSPFSFPRTPSWWLSL